MPKRQLVEQASKILSYLFILNLLLLAISSSLHNRTPRSGGGGSRASAGSRGHLQRVGEGPRMEGVGPWIKGAGRTSFLPGFL